MYALSWDELVQPCPKILNEVWLAMREDTRQLLTLRKAPAALLDILTGYQLVKSVCGAKHSSRSHTNTSIEAEKLIPSDIMVRACT